MREEWRRIISTRMPEIITEKIREFCAAISPGQIPLNVTVKPHPNSIINECFTNVKEIVEEKGGKIQFGWTIWEWPRVLIEAEFHAVWFSPEQQLIDITPKIPPCDTILFLPDNKMEYDYTRECYSVDNHRWPLSKDQLINDYIQKFMEKNIYEEEHRVGNKIHLEYEEIQIYENILKKIKELGIQIKRKYS